MLHRLHDYKSLMKHEQRRVRTERKDLCEYLDKESEPLYWIGKFSGQSSHVMVTYVKHAKTLEYNHTNFRKRLITLTGWFKTTVMIALVFYMYIKAILILNLY